MGENCLLMAGSHVAHDCRVGGEVVVANAVLLAGHVTSATTPSSAAARPIHQFMRVGEGAMVGGGSPLHPGHAALRPGGGAGRGRGPQPGRPEAAGRSREAIRELKEAFRLVYFTPGNIRGARGRGARERAFTAPPKRGVFLEFFGGGQRGFARAAADAAGRRGMSV